MKIVSHYIVIIIFNLVYENFKRPEKVKEIIFDVNKDQDDLLNISYLLKIFTLKVAQIDNEKNKNKTYFEVLFN